FSFISLRATKSEWRADRALTAFGGFGGCQRCCELRVSIEGVCAFGRRFTRQSLLPPLGGRLSLSLSVQAKSICARSTFTPQMTIGGLTRSFAAFANEPARAIFFQ